MLVDDPIYLLLKGLLETDEPAEFDALSEELKSALHERVENLRHQARSLKEKYSDLECRKRPRNNGKKH